MCKPDQNDALSALLFPVRGEAGAFSLPDGCFGDRSAEEKRAALETLFQTAKTRGAETLVLFSPRAESSGTTDAIAPDPWYDVSLRMILVGMACSVVVVGLSLKYTKNHFGSKATAQGAERESDSSAAMAANRSRLARA